MCQNSFKMDPGLAHVLKGPESSCHRQSAVPNTPQWLLNGAPKPTLRFGPVDL